MLVELVKRLVELEEPANGYMLCKEARGKVKVT